MGVIWGIPYLLIKVADGGVSVPVLVCTRVALGSLLLWPAALRGGHFGALKGHLRWLAAFTAAEIVGPFALLSNAERHLPSSTSGLLIAAVPIISALLALTYKGDRLTPVRWAGLAIGLAGVALLAGPGAGKNDALPVAQVLLTALGYAIGPLIASRKLPRRGRRRVRAVRRADLAADGAVGSGARGAGRARRDLHRGRVPGLLPADRRGRPGPRHRHHLRQPRRGGGPRGRSPRRAPDPGDRRVLRADPRRFCAGHPGGPGRSRRRSRHCPFGIILFFNE
jgi:multidrug transporter EmrE-like cation transporter